MNSRDYLLKKAKRSKQQKDWDDYKRVRNLTTSAIRKSKSNCHRNIFHGNVNKLKDFWSRIKQSYPVNDKKFTAKSFLVNNSMTTDKASISSAFCNFFCSVTIRRSKSQPSPISFLFINHAHFNPLAITSTKRSSLLFYGS